MAKNKEAGTEEKKENRILTVLIVILIVIIWLALFAALIKVDIGGFGSGVLKPILKDVPIVNLVLPGETVIKTPTTNDFEYKSLSEAVAKIEELQAKVDELSKDNKKDKTTISDLKAEVERLKVFEDNQKEFEKRVAEFDEKVVFAEQAPSIEEYKKFYEGIDPNNAAEIYKQVIEQLQYSKAIKEKADIYRSMEPKAAAKILETMTADIESVAQILLSMKPAQSAAILAEMDNVAAAKITKMMLDLDEQMLNK